MDEFKRFKIAEFSKRGMTKKQAKDTWKNTYTR